MRGGARAKVNRRLVRLGLPRLLQARSQNDPVYEGGPDGIPLPVPRHLPTPRVAMMWVPQSFGSPNIAGNQPADYWPGGKYVDWVGFDIYAKFRTAFGRDKAFFDQLQAQAVRDRRVRPLGQRPKRRLHRRAAALGRGPRPGEDADLLPRRRSRQHLTTCSSIPAPRRALRNHLAEPRWLEYAPGVKRAPATRRRPSRSGSTRPKRGPSLGEAAVDLGVGPAAERADLGVGVALAWSTIARRWSGFSAARARRAAAVRSRRSARSAGPGSSELRPSSGSRAGPPSGERSGEQADARGRGEPRAPRGG